MSRHPVAVMVRRARKAASRVETDERGDIASSVIVLPVFFLLVMAVFQFAFWLLDYESAQESASYGAQVLSASGYSPGGAQDSVAQGAASEMYRRFTGSMSADVEVTSGGVAPYDRVTVLAAVTPILALPGLDLRVSASANGRQQCISAACQG